MNLFRLASLFMNGGFHIFRISSWATRCTIVVWEHCGIISRRNNRRTSSKNHTRWRLRKRSLPLTITSETKISCRVGGMERNYKQVCECLWQREWWSNKNTTTSFLSRSINWWFPTIKYLFCPRSPQLCCSDELRLWVKIMTWLFPHPYIWLHHPIAY